MRVAVVTPELHRGGGTERATAELVSRLALQHQICVFANVCEPEIAAHVCFHRVPRLPKPGLLKFSTFFYLASWQVRRAGRKHGNYDVVYSPGPNCRQVQVATAHFCQARNLGLLLSGKHSPPLQTISERLKRINRILYAQAVSRMERRFYRAAGLERVLVPSRLLAQDLGEFYGLPQARVRVAPSGVNGEHFNPELRAGLRDRARRELELPPDRFVFFFIGNNWLIKGLYHLMRALPHVPDALLMVVGADVERVDSWRRLSEQCGVADRVRYLDRRTDVAYYYAAADALLAPSVYDTFALMPLEAMACGLPVIVSRNAGVAEIIGPDDAIVVKDIEDATELGAAMRRVAGDAALRARLAANGLRLTQRHPWDENFKAIESALQQVAAAHASGRNGDRPS